MRITYPFTKNVGDDLQSIELIMIANRDIDLMPRDSIEDNMAHLDNFLLHGWLSRNKFSPEFKPQKAKNFCALSIHIADKRHLEGEWKSFFRHCGHIFTRDFYTKKIFEAVGIHSSFSGCLTTAFGVCEICLRTQLTLKIINSIISLKTFIKEVSPSAVMKLRLQRNVEKNTCGVFGRKCVSDFAKKDGVSIIQR